MKQAKFKINGQIKICKILEEYANGTIRIEYPIYYNGIYNGYENLTISKKDLTDTK